MLKTKKVNNNRFFSCINIIIIIFEQMSKKTSNLNRSRNPMDFNYDDIEPLSRFVSESGKILPRKETGLSAKLQRRITKLIKQGRNMLTMK